MGWNPVKEAEKKAKEAVSKVIKPAVREAEGAVWKARRAAYAKITETGRKIEDNLDKVEDQAESRLRKVGEEVEDGLTEKLPDLVEDAARAIAEEASERSIKEALDNAADVIEMMAPTRFTLIFGIELALVVQGEVGVSVTFPNPAAKLTEIRHWANDPPSGRAQIIECIKDFGPESLGAEFKISGNGLAVEWDGDQKYERLDAFLEKHGVD